MMRGAAPLAVLAALIAAGAAGGAARAQEVELDPDLDLEGKILSERGRLLVGETGAIDAEIRVGVASISGTVTGTLLASEKVEIHSTGRFYGNLHAPALIIEEGAVFEGNCAMASTAEQHVEHPAHSAEVAETAAG